MNGAPVPPQGNPAPKGKALAWILGGCVVILVISGIAVSAFMWWTYHKAKTYVTRAIESESKKVESGNMTAVAELWPDVPRMDGMIPAHQVDMPVGLKLIARPILDGMMRGVNDGKAAGHWDWTAFSLNGKTAADVQAFYVPAKMTPNGWQSQGGCSNMPTGLSGNEATLCAFQKEQGNKTTGLLIIAANDEKEKAVSVFFIRQEAENTAPTNAQQSPSVDTSNVTPPFGVDQRPMPAGLNLDVLLPARVGDCARTSLRNGGSNTTPTTAKLDDGNSIYAEYLYGGTKIFVEFAATSSSANAQSILQTVADENIGRGQFPTDPQKGRIGSDPSYLKLFDAQGALFAWTRGGYYFAVSAPTASAVESFMKDFPY